MKKTKGFTLVELVLVITILGVLAVAAFPSFINVAERAEEMSEYKAVNAVRAGIEKERVESQLTQDGSANNSMGDGTYPTTLGDGAASNDCSQDGCFTGVMTTPLYDQRWSHDGALNYEYMGDDGMSYEYVYTPGTGKFEMTPP